jgi:hypothetical protein
LEDVGVDGRILELIIRKISLESVRWIHPAQDPVESSPGSVKGGAFLDQLRNYQLLDKDFDPWN